MLETPHVIVGAAIAVKVLNPVLAIPLAFGSHFILEKVPHWNPHLNSEIEKFGKPTKKSTLIVIVDASIALISGIIIALLFLPDYVLSATILFACLFSILPDLIEGPYFFLNKRSSSVKKWIHFQKSLQSDTTLIPGLTTQIITIIAALVWIFT